jgi:hypothetical protein
MRRIKTAVFFVLLSIGASLVLLCSPVPVWAAANGSISGTLNDPSRAVVPGATVTLVNTALKSEYKAISNGQGFYSFPTIPVGHYDLTIEATGFRPQTKTNSTVDTANFNICPTHRYYEIFPISPPRP